MKNIKKISVKCLGLNEQGQGIINIDKKEYFVNNLLPKEEAMVEINDEFKYQKAKVVKVIKASPARVNPKCDVYQKCGGCQLLHLNYPAQVEFKHQYVINAFKQYKIKIRIDEVVEAFHQECYRNKMQVAYRYKEGKIIYGFYEEESHRIIPLNKCLVQTNLQNEIAKYIQVLMTKMKIQPYNEDKKSGLIRFALIKQAFTTQEILVTIVTNGDIFPGRSEFVKQLRLKFPEISTIIQNINTRKTSIILGEQERILFGNGYIIEELLGIKFKISSKTFFQINPVQTEKLYQKIIDYGKFTGTEVLIDAYCGVGTIGIILSKYVKQVIGVESNKQSVNNAIQNLKDNKINNVRFVCDDATRFIEKLSDDHEKIDVVVMDPPRSGSTEKFLNSVLKLKPQKVIYVSCEAKTLARDVSLLQKSYQIKQIALVDMFVGTYHVEVVCLLELR